MFLLYSSCSARENKYPVLVCLLELCLLHAMQDELSLVFYLTVIFLSVVLIFLLPSVIEYLEKSVPSFLFYIAYYVLH